MTPILIYANNEAQVKLFNDIAHDNDVKVVRFSEKELEAIDDLLFGQKLVERDKNFKPVPMEDFKKMAARKLEEK